MKFTTNLQGLPSRRSDRSRPDPADRPFGKHGPRVGKPTSLSTGKNSGLGVFQPIYS